MNKEEFKKYVISEATKYIFSKEEETPSETLNTLKENVTISTEEVKANKPSISPSEIKKLAEEMKQINKKIDLRNPLISESSESLVESIIKKNKNAPLDVDGINKKKHINFQNEGEKEKWNRMLNYNIPDDENRD